MAYGHFYFVFRSKTKAGPTFSNFSRTLNGRLPLEDSSYFDDFWTELIHMIRWPTHGSLSVTKQIVFRSSFAVLLPLFCRSYVLLPFFCRSFGVLLPFFCRSFVLLPLFCRSFAVLLPFFCRSSVLLPFFCCSLWANRHAEAPMRWPSNITVCGKKKREKPKTLNGRLPLEDSSVFDDPVLVLIVMTWSIVWDTLRFFRFFVWWEGSGADEGRVGWDVKF